jgi:hypothetical protein
MSFMRIRCVPEDVNCDVLARLETGLLNELMGTTGRADNVGSSREQSDGSFSVYYFR